MAMTGDPASCEDNKRNWQHEDLILSLPAERLEWRLGVGYARGIPVHAGRLECTPAVEDESDERYA